MCATVSSSTLKKVLRLTALACGLATSMVEENYAQMQATQANGDGDLLRGVEGYSLMRLQKMVRSQYDKIELERQKDAERATLLERKLERTRLQNLDLSAKKESLHVLENENASIEDKTEFINKWSDDDMLRSGLIDHIKRSWVDNNEGSKIETTLLKLIVAPVVKVTNPSEVDSGETLGVVSSYEYKFNQLLWDLRYEATRFLHKLWRMGHRVRLTVNQAEIIRAVLLDEGLEGNELAAICNAELEQYKSMLTESYWAHEARLGVFRKAHIIKELILSYYMPVYMSLEKRIICPSTAPQGSEEEVEAYKILISAVEEILGDEVTDDIKSNIQKANKDIESNIEVGFSTNRTLYLNRIEKIIVMDAWNTTFGKV